ncbi:MAG: exopolyphosphatase [Crocinitomicaceae bacterium]|nr:exopolyphosphatase [Crocinitomicaceae bacterium]MBK8926200.1 exopolyphosphatase [Crocinitomicaceae bacterium]
MIYGAVDIGTNATRLLIGEIAESNGRAFVKKLSYVRVPLRLGMDVFENGRISDHKITEFKKTMHAFKLIAEVFDVNELRACATSAMREAENGEAVRELIEKETGLKIEIIRGQEEAELIFSTFMLLEHDHDDPFIVIDVGGGSTEITVFSKNQKPISKSFRLGTIRMIKGKAEKSAWKEMENWLEENLRKSDKYKVFGTGGNINKIHKFVGKKEKDAIHYKELEDVYEKLEKYNINERMEKFNLKPDRADVIVPACVIYLNALKEIKAKEIFVPKVGLADGMIYNMHMKKQQVPA